jgi:hypothetical protein
MNRRAPEGSVHRLVNILAFERRCIHSGFVALPHRTLKYVSVVRLAGRGASTFSVLQAIYETVHFA